MSGYQATGVAMATGGTAVQVAAWVANRPSSAGTPGGPNRGPSERSSNQPRDGLCAKRCVLEHRPPLANGSAPAATPGARVFLLSNQTAVLDAEGPLSGLISRTPTTFAAAR